MPFDANAYNQGAGKSFVSTEEKDVLIDEGTPLVFTAVTFGPSKYGERFIATTEIEGEERAIGFPAGTVESRDAQLHDLQTWLADGGEAPTLKIVRVGRALILENAE
jgi:hypothetical protein